MNIVKGARPIKTTDIQIHYGNHSYQEFTLKEYAEIWLQWLENSQDKKILGLDQFIYRDFTAGTSAVFDHFILKHCASREIVVLPGEFQYHKCVSKNLTLSVGDKLNKNSALIISLPFSDYGRTHPDFYKLLEQCNLLGVPVCLDLAYWGVSKNVQIDLYKYPCISEVTASLSKPFYTLETHRVGIRFTKDYQDDGISMLNEVGMQNFYSISLGIHYMRKFSADWNWQTHCNSYYQLCSELELSPCDTVLFGIGDKRFENFNRGIPDNNRVCISPGLENL